MPPKGWRKNSEGQFPQPNKDQGYVSIDEILFPASTVQKLAKKIINTHEEGEKESNMLLAKDSSVALQRSATVFVSHLMFHARQISKENSRKTVNAQDILQALERAEFGGFVSEVKLKLSSFEATVEQKKIQKLAGVKNDHGDQSEQLAKRMKDNDNNVVQQLSENSKDEIETEELGNNADIVETTATEELNEEANESMEADETEEQVDNPIAALEKEEKELGGSGDEDEENNDDNSSDDDEN